jgi:hypothetical protein
VFFERGRFEAMAESSKRTVAHHGKKNDAAEETAPLSEKENP